MKLSRSLPGLLLLLSGAALAQEGVASYKYTVHAQTAAPTGESRVYFSPTAMRMEMQMNMGSEKEKARGQAAGMPTSFRTTMIQRASEPDKLYTINDERRTYSVTDLAEIRDANPRSDTTYTVKRQGSDRVAGIACDKALVTSSKGNEIEVCISNDFVASPSWLAAMNRQARRDNWMKATRDAGLKGFPVRVQFLSKEKGGVDMTMELVSLEKKPVPSALFQIPAGYKEISASTVNMTPEQEKRMQDALANMTPEQRKAYEDAMKAQGKKQ